MSKRGSTLGTFGVLLAALTLASAAVAQPSPEQTLRALLTEFLDAAGRGDKAVFERFFADDVIYTRATGVVVTKADIMKSLDEPRPADAPKMAYSAEDVNVRVHGNTAVVNFRLISRTTNDGAAETVHYRNTGVFINLIEPCTPQSVDVFCGRWRVVAWQATKLAEPEKK